MPYKGRKTKKAQLSAWANLRQKQQIHSRRHDKLFAVQMWHRDRATTHNSFSQRMNGLVGRTRTAGTIENEVRVMLWSFHRHRACKKHQTFIIFIISFERIHCHIVWTKHMGHALRMTKGGAQTKSLLQRMKNQVKHKECVASVRSRVRIRSQHRH